MVYTVLTTMWLVKNRYPKWLALVSNMNGWSAIGCGRSRGEEAGDTTRLEFFEFTRPKPHATRPPPEGRDGIQNQPKSYGFEIPGLGAGMKIFHHTACFSSV